MLNAILFFLFIFRFIINETLPTSCHLLWIEPIMCCLFLLSMVKRQIEPIHFVSFRFGCGVARRHRKDVIHFHGLCVTDISLFFVCTFSDWEELKKISQYFFYECKKKYGLKAFGTRHASFETRKTDGRRLEWEINFGIEKFKHHSMMLFKQYFICDWELNIIWCWKNVFGYSQ